MNLFSRKKRLYIRKENSTIDRKYEQEKKGETHMKKMKRWLALVLAIALVSTNAIYQLGTHMSASESSQDTSVSEEQPQQEEQAADSQTQDTTEHTDSGQASVQEVTPDQSATATTQQAADVQQAADAQQTGAAQTDVAKTIAVKIQKSDVDGGTVKVVNADGSKSDVTYDGNNQYAKEVTEGESFGFEVTAKDGYQVEQVTDQNGTAIQPVSVNGNVSTYNVTDIRSEKVFSVTYNKVETQTEEKKDEKTENKAEDATATEETEDQNDADTQVTSTAGETHEDTDTEKWITVGKTVTLSNEYKSSAWTTYTHSWQIKKGNDVVSINASNSNSISVKGKKAGEATITDTITWNSFFEGQQKKTITYTIHVSEAVAPTAITINGADSVTQFKDINLTYTLTPTGAEGTVQWSSSNEDILTVDSSGKVTGLRRGQATVTANVYSGQSLLCSATKTIQVVEDTTVAGDSAIVYYLLDPTKDANSNDSGNWGPAYGTAKVNVTGATWTGGRNCFDNVDQRVVSWPNGTNVVTRDSTAWNQIFNKYKSSVEEQLGVPITEDDVVSITLRPAKISRNNSSTPDLHLDCNVDVNCKRVSIVHYYLLDKSSDPNSTEYVHQGSKSYINGNKTNPETVTGKSFPRTKTGTDGATYTFSGWYTDQELTQPATFPYTVNSNVNFYAKYVAGRQVVYNLDGGSFSDESSLTEKHNEGENVVVKSEPTRKGYKFTGWTVEGLDGVSSINSGASFQMPNNNVTITANWEEQKIEDFVELTPKDVEKVYDGEAHAAGVATATDKNGYQLKIEYSVDGENWTENPADITATNVSDSKTIKVRVSNEEKYTGYIEKTEKLAITRRPVTVTANSCQKTFGTADPEFTAKVEGTLGNDKVDYKLSREKGEDVGTYTITSTGDEKQGNYKVTYNPGTLTIVAAQRTTELSVTSYNGVYDAKKHTIAVNGTVDGDKVEYSYDGGKTWVADLKEYKNVTDGSVAIQVKVTNTNYTPSETILNGTVTITPFPLVVKADDKSKVFGEKDPKLTATETSGVEGKEKPDNQKIERTMTREAGENVGNYKITASGETTQGNYTVTYKPGTLTITAGSRPADRQLSVTSYNGVYDAQKHTITVNNVLDGDVVEYSYDGGKTWTTDLTKYTDVTNTTIKVRVTNANYDPNPVDLEGTVTITPKPVTVTARSYSKTFGAADPVFKADTAGTLNGDKITYDISRETGENVGTYTITPAGEAVQGNYNVTYATGTLTITASDREKAVEVTSYNGVYDAKNHTIEVKNLVDGDQVEYSYDNGTTWTTDLTKYKDVTDTTILVKVTNANYAKVPQLTGTVTITRFPLVVKAEDKSKVFGEKDPKLTAAETSGLEGKAKPDKQEITYDLSREAGENVGEYPITVKGEVVQGNYTVTYEPGKLTITKAERAKDIEVVNYKNVYDAGNHTIEVKNLVDGDKVEYSYDGGKTWTTDLKQYKDVTAEVKIQVKVTNDNYKPVDTKTGTVEITRRPVTVTANSYQKTFGETDPEFTAKVKGTLGNDKVDYKLSREKGENVGTYTITPTGDEKQGNYTVTYKPGSLTIVAAQRTTELSVTSYNGVYDAKKHTITVNGTVAGDKVEYSYNGITWSDKLKEYTDVIDTEIKVRVTNSNYEPAVTDNLYGRVTITSRPISITGEGWDTDQLYTGKAYKTDKFEWENANKANTRGLVDGQSVNTTYKLEGTNVSEKPYTGVFTAVQIMSADNKDVTNNYTVKTNPGTLKIVAQSINPGPNPENPDPSYDGIQIDSPSDVEYDGQAHKWSPTVTDKNGNALTEDTDYEVSYDKDDFTDVKTITVTITGKGNYTGTVTRVYNILAAPLIIRTEKAEKTYDGKPLTNENMTIEGLKNGEVVAHKTTGTQTEVGNSDNTYELDWNSKESTAKESNYIIKEVSLGKLVVKETEDEIVVTTTGGTFTYDGQPHGATVEVSELPEGYTLQTAESDATATDVTTEAVTADADRLVIVNAAGVDVTANLKITRVTGEIVVNPATVTVTTPNASKVYDGTPLTAAGTITGLVNGETVSFATTGTITNVGTATNSYSLVWDQTAKETNYTVSENLGTLTVTAPTNNNPSVTPIPPATPNPPATPSDNPGVLDRVVDTIKDVAADVQEVFSSDDGDVPLANQNLDEHKCCILHFLIMLLTAILYGFFTHNMKKRQKKNFELREELDTELVKRGLPTSKEQKNS